MVTDEVADINVTRSPKCYLHIVGIDSLTTDEVARAIELNADKVNVRSTDITLRGSGDISVDFMEGCHEVQANLTGSGDVTLKGHVGKYSQQKSGAGDIDTNHLTLE